MGEKRWVLMSDLFCLFLGCVVVSVFYFCDGSEKVGFFTSSILNQEDKPFGDIFEAWGPGDDGRDNDSGDSIDLQPEFIARAEVEGRLSNERWDNEYGWGRESEAVWMEEIQRDIDRFMRGPMEPEGRGREILVSRSSLYRLRQVEFEPSGAMEFKVSVDILVTVEVGGR